MEELTDEERILDDDCMSHTTTTQEEEEEEDTESTTTSSIMSHSETNTPRLMNGSDDSTQIDAEDDEGTRSEPVVTPRRKTKDELRTDVEREIETSEQTYVEGLIHLEEFYILPLKQLVNQPNPAKGMLTPKEFHSIFQCISVIKNVNVLLLDTIRSLRAGTPKVGEESIGKIFLRLGPMLKTYTDYVNNYDNIVKSVKDWRKTKPAFDSFMVTTESRALQESRVGFFSYMISPVQRIPRYNLLLRELIRYTEETHEDYGSLKKALDLTQEISAHVNERLREHENQRKMIWLYQNVPSINTNIENFFQTSRKITYDGEVAIVSLAKSNSGRILRHRHLYLTNDLVLFTKKTKYKAHSFLDTIPEIWLFADPNQSTEFTIVTNSAAHRIRVANEEARKVWIDKLSEAITNSQKDKKQDLPKAIIYRRKGKKLKGGRLVKAQAENDKIISFKKGELLIVHYDYGDGSSLVSLAEEGTVAGCKVRNILFRELTVEEKLNCELVSDKEKQKLRDMKPLANNRALPQGINLENLSLSEMKMVKTRRPQIPLEYITALHHSIDKKLGVDTTEFDVQQAMRRSEMLRQIKSSHPLIHRQSTDDLSGTDTSSYSGDLDTDTDDRDTISRPSSAREITKTASPVLNFKLRSHSENMKGMRSEKIATEQIIQRAAMKIDDEAKRNNQSSTDPAKSLAMELKKVNIQADPNLDKIIQERARMRSQTASQVNGDVKQAQLKRVEQSSKGVAESAKAPWLLELENKKSSIVKKLEHVHNTCDRKED